MKYVNQLNVNVNINKNLEYIFYRAELWLNSNKIIGIRLV